MYIVCCLSLVNGHWRHNKCLQLGNAWNIPYQHYWFFLHICSLIKIKCNDFKFYMLLSISCCSCFSLYPWFLPFFWSHRPKLKLYSNKNKITIKNTQITQAHSGSGWSKASFKSKGRMNEDGFSAKESDREHPSDPSGRNLMLPAYNCRRLRRNQLKINSSQGLL